MDDVLSLVCRADMHSEYVGQVGSGQVGSGWLGLEQAIRRGGVVNLVWMEDTASMPVDFKKQ